MTGLTVTFTIHTSQRSAVISRFLPAAAGLALSMVFLPSARAEGSLFNAVSVDLSKFVLVSAPIGTGERSQLNIYEQRSDKRPCFSVSGSAPAVVDPLLSSFDFSGICNTGRDMELRASPSRDRSQPSFVIATTGGAGRGFLQLKFQPGWTLKRRAYGTKNLGHMYIYRDAATAAQ